MTRRCANCEWRYPAEILSSMFLNGHYTDPICGICAEAITIEIHGVPLHGERACQTRDDAEDWRTKHPEHAPPSCR